MAPAREIRLPAEVAEFSRLSDFIERQLPDIPPVLLNTLLIVAEEIFVNIANYAYPGAHGDMLMELETPPGWIVLRFTDSGQAFNPLARPDPDIHQPPENRIPGGMGIFMVKKMTDAIEYARQDGHNILTLRKRLPSPASP